MWLDRWKLVVGLRDSGMTFREVAEWLNKNGYKPPRGKRYYKQLVQATYYNVKERVAREMDKGEIHTLREWVVRRKV